MPRPTKLTPDTQAKIEQAIKLGATYELAAQYAGIHYDTFNNWRKRGEAELKRREGNVKADTKLWNQEQPFVELYEAVKKAEGLAVVGWLAKIEAAANDGNWQAAAWKLERRYPSDYNRNRVEHTGKDGGVIETKHTVTFENLSDDDLDNLIQSAD